MPLDGETSLGKPAASTISLNGARRIAIARPAGYLSESRATNPTANALAGLAVIPFALRGPYRVKGLIEARRRELDALGWGDEPVSQSGPAPRELKLSFEK